MSGVNNHPIPHAVASMQDIVTDDPQSWDILWQRNILPWDTGDIQPPLRQVIEGGDVSFPKGGRALVPGCGRGYDTIYLASVLGHETYGLESSSTAIAAARELLISKSVSSEVKSRIHYEDADFFNYQVADDEKFDLIYDFTFFVAIPPPKRSLCGAKINSLIKHGGYLITLMFPHVSEPYTTGPPFYANFDSYADVLGEGWEVVYDRIPDDATLEGVHKGKDRMVVWRRK
ncbi:hypothetical protein D9757_006981 [Collybiopsis confluens]|uniref:S-adenosyl-L-methionine-dependent methyltransferase n=1 Tax=Collybiopsis confluens TaxID=2823264 RepID=A0A8H5HJB0_9AGAR|nr:hypothetical protein D9757_006981 [Collybiopsis confluens]